MARKHPKKVKQLQVAAKFERKKAAGNKQCPSCLTYDTPMWRRAEWPYGSGRRILFCNLCGLRCKKMTLEPPQLANLALLEVTADPGGKAASTPSTSGGAQARQEAQAPVEPKPMAPLVQQSSCSSGALVAAVEADTQAAAAPAQDADADETLSVANHVHLPASGVDQPRPRLQLQLQLLPPAAPAAPARSPSPLSAVTAAESEVGCCAASQGAATPNAVSAGSDVAPPAKAAAKAASEVDQCMPFPSSSTVSKRRSVTRKRKRSVESADMAPGTPVRAPRVSVSGRPRRTCKSTYG